MFTVGLLAEATFPAFAAMVERNKIWGGCPCLGFHGTENTMAIKEQRVREDRSHAALVFDGEANEVPDWRITCFVVDREYRGRGVAELALRQALAEIERQGGGLVESFPEDTAGRKTSGSFLFNATLSLFERCGFERVRKLGKNAWLVRRRL